MFGGTGILLIRAFLRYVDEARFTITIAKVWVGVAAAAVAAAAADAAADAAVAETSPNNVTITTAVIERINVSLVRENFLTARTAGRTLLIIIIPDSRIFVLFMAARNHYFDAQSPCV